MISWSWGSKIVKGPVGHALSSTEWKSWIKLAEKQRREGKKSYGLDIPSYRIGGARTRTGKNFNIPARQVKKGWWDFFHWRTSIRFDMCQARFSNACFEIFGAIFTYKNIVWDCVDSSFISHYWKTTFFVNHFWNFLSYVSRMFAVQVNQVSATKAGEACRGIQACKRNYQPPLVEPALFSIPTQWFL